MFLNDKYIVVFLINNYAIEERRGSVYMMKKLLMVLFCFPILCNINVFASEYVQDELLEENLDLTEEIEMFDSFYQQPDRYIFQDINGDDLNGFVMQYKDEFYKNQYQTTDFLMEYVRSVQDLGSVISYYSGRSIQCIIRRRLSLMLFPCHLCARLQCKEGRGFLIHPAVNAVRIPWCDVFQMHTGICPKHQCT